MTEATKISDSAQLQNIKSAMDAERAPLERKLAEMVGRRVKEIADILTNNYHKAEIDLLTRSKPQGFFESAAIENSRSWGFSSGRDDNFSPIEHEVKIKFGNLPLLDEDGWTEYSDRNVKLVGGWAAYNSALPLLEKLGLIRKFLVGEGKTGRPTHVETIRTFDGEMVLEEINRRHAAWLARQEEPIAEA